MQMILRILPQVCENSSLMSMITTLPCLYPPLTCLQCQDVPAAASGQ